MFNNLEPSRQGLCSCCVQGTMKVFHLTAGFIYPQLLHEEENADLGLANPWYTCPSATKDPFALTPLGKKSRTGEKKKEKKKGPVS